MNELWEIAAKIALSALLGGIVGAEREWTGKWAGLRTHMLIAVGAALLTDMSIHIGPRFAEGSNAWDPGRIAAQIVSGIGFLGAGTIIQARGTVRGLTTAAGIWVAAAIGMAVGATFYIEATVATLALLVILVALRPVERYVFSGESRTILVELPGETPLSELLDLMEDGGVDIDLKKVERVEGTTVVHLSTGRSKRARHRLMEIADTRGYRAYRED